MTVSLPPSSDGRPAPTEPAPARPLRGRPRAALIGAFAQSAIYWAEYAAFRTIMALFWSLGLERASAFGGWFARTLGPRLPVSGRAHRNLAMAMPELSAAERQRIVVAMWDNLGRTFAEYPHLKHFKPFAENSRIDVVNLDHARAAIAKDRGGFFVSGHFGNWEVLAMCIRAYGLKGTLVYRAPNNPYVDRWITAQRQAYVLPTMAPKGADGARVILRTLKEKHFLAMLIDQKMNDGVPVPFFGRDAMTTTAAAQLSLKSGAPIIAVASERLPGPRFKISIYPEIAITPSGDRAKDIFALTLKLNEFLEARIREKPEMWLWLHNRWPKGAAEPREVSGE